jgi:hypothetical protein
LNRIGLGTAIAAIASTGPRSRRFGTLRAWKARKMYENQ